MKKTALLFLILISVSLSSQIKGKITDTNGKPLSFVSIYLENTVQELEDSSNQMDIGYIGIGIGVIGISIAIIALVKTRKN